MQYQSIVSDSTPVDQPQDALASGNQQEADALSKASRRFRPVPADDTAPRRVRLLRSEHRARTQIRALLYAGHGFQTTTITDLSPSGAGINGASYVAPGDLVAVQLLDGKAIPGQIRWWLAGRCGIAFLEPLREFDAILNGPHNRLRPAPMASTLPQDGTVTSIAAPPSNVAPASSSPVGLRGRMLSRFMRQR